MNAVIYFMNAIVENALAEMEEYEPQAFRGLRIAKEVCDVCDGQGTTWHGYAGTAFTASEWELLDGDDRDGYMSGRYDQPCPQCRGNNVVDAVSEEDSETAAYAMFTNIMEGLAADAAVSMMEQRMGC